MVHRRERIGGFYPYRQVFFTPPLSYMQLTVSYSVHVVEAAGPPALPFYARPSRAETDRRS